MKRIVICCDGTWNRADSARDGLLTPTNVVRSAYLTAKAFGGGPQIVMYDQGVGTGNSLDRLSGGAFGRGLDEHIYEAYRFLVANYELGDEIYFFGFSRGAFTVRSIAGMIRKCGVLMRGSVAQYLNAVALYRDEQHPDFDGPKLFRKTHSIAGEDPIPIKFIGVWDTVGALGIPLRGLRALTRRKYQFHDTELSGTVQFAYQALAIDERREPFQPTLWLHKPKPNQTVEQVWFLGVHSDVGGGYAERELSDIALQWMMEKAVGAGLALDAQASSAHPPQPRFDGKLHDSAKLLYRIPGLGGDRRIGFVRRSASSNDLVRDPTQSIHPTALRRWDNVRTYRPKALRDYFERIDDPRSATR